MKIKLIVIVSVAAAIHVVLTPAQAAPKRGLVNGAAQRIKTRGRAALKNTEVKRSSINESRSPVLKSSDAIQDKIIKMPDEYDWSYAAKYDLLADENKAATDLSINRLDRLIRVGRDKAHEFIDNFSGSRAAFRQQEFRSLADALATARANYLNTNLVLAGIDDEIKLINLSPYFTDYGKSLHIAKIRVVQKEALENLPGQKRILIDLAGGDYTYDEIQSIDWIFQRLAQRLPRDELASIRRPLGPREFRFQTNENGWEIINLDRPRDAPSKFTPFYGTGSQ